MSPRAGSAKRKRKQAPAARKVEELDVRSTGDVSPHRSTVLYGPSGTGKTTFAATWPTPMLLLDVNDRGTDSISDVEGIDIKEVNIWDDFELVYYWLLKNEGEYKTIVVDTLSQVQDLVIASIVGGEEGGTIRGPTQREWGEISSTMKLWITNYRNLPMEVVFIAQERVFQVDEDLDPEVQLDPEVGPRLSPSVAAHLNASVSVIGNTYIRRRIRIKEVRVRGKKDPVKKEIPVIEFCLRLAPDPVYRTKIRKPRGIKVPSILVDPHYEDIIDIISGGK